MDSVPLAHHVQELAAVGVYLQYLVGWHENVTAVQLAAYLLPRINDTDFNINGRSVLSIVKETVGNSSLTIEDASEVLSNFERLPNERQTWMVPAWISFMIISGICLLIRLLSRKYNVGRLKADDWLVLAAWIVGSVTNIEDSWTAICHNWGSHVWHQVYQDIRIRMIIGYVDTFVYIVSMTLVRTALLLLYRELIGHHRAYSKIGVGIIMVVIWIYFFGCIAYFAGVCSPIDKWNHPYDVKCISAALPLGLATTVFNMVIDVMILILPLAPIYKLSLRRADKIPVMILICLGSLTCVTSGLRIVEWKPYLESNDLSWRTIRISTWSMLEPHLCVICACLPSFRKFFARFIPMFKTKNSTFRSFPTNTARSNVKWGFESCDDHDGPQGPNYVVRNGTTVVEMVHDITMKEEIYTEKDIGSKEAGITTVIESQGTSTPPPAPEPPEPEHSNDYVRNHSSQRNLIGRSRMDRISEVREELE